MTGTVSTGSRSLLLASSASGTPSLRDREWAILSALARDGDNVAFQGLRRRLGLHPQALTRSLRQLEAGGYIARDTQGYRLASEGLGALAQRAPDLTSTPFRPVFAAFLPPHVDSSVLVERLSHRWFRGLRWFGISRVQQETLLTWLAEPQQTQVRLRVAGPVVGLEAAVTGAGGPSYESIAALLEAVASFFAAAPPAPTLPAAAPAIPGTAG